MRVYTPVPAPDAHVPHGRAFKGEPRRIGVVDDAMDPSLMHGIVDHLKAALTAATIDFRVKATGTSPAPDSLIEEMAREIDVAITGVGM